MSSRYERRMAKREIKKIKQSNIKRLLLSELSSGKASEVYRLDNDGTGKTRYFDVAGMRAWAEENLEIFGMPPYFERAKELVDSGAVELDHIKDHTVQTAPRPIIVCRGLGIDGGDQIVDGAHTFVAMCMGSAMLNKEIQIPAYVLTAGQWEQFIIPDDIAVHFQ